MTKEEKSKIWFCNTAQDLLYKDALATMESDKRSVGSEQLSIAMGYLKLEIAKREILEKYEQSNRNTSTE